MRFYKAYAEWVFPAPFFMCTSLCAIRLEN